MIISFVKTLIIFENESRQKGITLFDSSSSDELNGIGFIGNFHLGFVDFPSYKEWIRIE